MNIANAARSHQLARRRRAKKLHQHIERLEQALLVCATQDDAEVDRQFEILLESLAIPENARGAMMLQDCQVSTAARFCMPKRSHFAGLLRDHSDGSRCVPGQHRVRSRCSRRRTAA